MIARLRTSWVAVLLIVFASVFVPTNAVSAHAGLEESEPKPSSWLATSPSEVVLYFDEPVGVVFARIQILDQDGKEVFEARPTRDADDHATVRANIDELGDGTWVVVWRVASADSHPVQGSFAFSIGTRVSDVTAVLNAGISDRHGLNNLFNVIRFAMFAGVLTLLGGAALVAFGSRSAPSIRTRMSLWSAWAVALFASVQALFAYGPHASGVKIYSLTDLSLLGDTMTTLFGQATLARVLLLLLFSLVLITIDHRSQRWWRISAIAIAVAVAGSMSAVGHPINQSPVGLSVALDMMHLLAVSMWVGGLFLITIDRKYWLRSTQSMLWFSRIAGYSVVILATTGIGQTFLLMDRFSDVFTIEFGQKLSVKVLLVAALVALGGLSRRTLHAAGPAKLHQSVLVESLVALIIVGITALFVALPPSAQASLVPFETTLKQSDLIATVTVTPARVGTTEIHVSIASLDGTFLQIQSITGRVGLPERSLPNGPISFEKTGPDHYTAIVSFAFAGDWDLDILVKPTDTTTVLFSTDVLIKK